MVQSSKPRLASARRGAPVVSTLIVGVVAVLLALVVAGCATISAASGRPSSAASTAGQEVIWGEVPATPSCPCDHPDYLGRVSRGLAQVHLDKNFTVRDVEGQWQRFTVTYNPATVPTKKVEEIIKERGGTVVSVGAVSAPEPPASTPVPIP